MPRRGTAPRRRSHDLRRRGHRLHDHRRPAAPLLAQRVSRDQFVMREMGETLRTTFRRMLRLENRRAAVRPGRLETIEAFESKILGNTRQVTVYLPAGYDEREDRRYPVLY